MRHSTSNVKQEQGDSGKFLTFFSRKDEEYGIEILKVQEIIGMMSITQCRARRPFVRGVNQLCEAKSFPLLICA